MVPFQATTPGAERRADGRCFGNAADPAPLQAPAPCATRSPLLLLRCSARRAGAAQTFPKFTGLRRRRGERPAAGGRSGRSPPSCEALQKDTKRQLVVATIPDLQGYPLEDYGYRLGRAWGVGLKDVDNGAILFVAPNESAGQRGPRIEVGYGLEAGPDRCAVAA